MQIKHLFLLFVILLLQQVMEHINSKWQSCSPKGLYIDYHATLVLLHGSVI